MATNMSSANRAARRQQERQQRRQSGSTASASRPRAPEASQWHRSPAADRERAEKLDGFASLRNKLRSIGEAKGEWAGLPMPLEGEHLVVEPRYPFAAGLMAINTLDQPEGDPELKGAKVRNSFWSWRKRSHVDVIELADGKITWGIRPGVHHLAQTLQTLGCAEAWGIEQESAALDLLATLLDHRRFKQYLLTGTFIESSKRSGVFYLFRRLKPTVAINTIGKTTRVLCALCMHPIAYYSGSWAGAMTPTDDVIAHLMLMRGDEAMFWRRSSQHPAHVPQAGL